MSTARSRTSTRTSARSGTSARTSARSGTSARTSDRSGTSARSRTSDSSRTSAQSRTPGRSRTSPRSRTSARPRPPRRPTARGLVPSRSRYLPGLDGVRALAVVAVVVYHIDPGWLPGGFLGVDVFFVLSGYLITDLLRAERHRTGCIDLARFWIRRARRLLPALVTVLVAATACAALLRPGRIDPSGHDVLSALTFTNNWWQISTHASYFATFGPPPLFQHLWTLGVEEQFYLVWPLVVLVLFRLTRDDGPPRPSADRSGARHRGRAWLRGGLVLALALASVTAMALLHRPGTDPSRIYFGTDTHAFGLLLGAALALALPSDRAWRHTWARAVCGLAGVLGCLLLGLLAWTADARAGWLYPWGFAAASCAAGAVVVAAVQGESAFARLLGTSWPRWIGRRSYGIYLWHLPLIALAVPNGHGPGHAPLNALVAAALSVLLAGLSYRWIEAPVRRKGLRRTAVALYRALTGGSGRGAAAVRRTAGADADDTEQPFPRAEVDLTRPMPPPAPDGPGAGRRQGARRRRRLRAHRAVPVLAGLAVLIAFWGIATADAGHRAGDQVAAGERALTGHDTPRPRPRPSGSHTSTPEITAVGDSVMLAAAPALKEKFPGIRIDAQVSRQLLSGPAEVTALKAGGRLTSVLLVGLGTNGSGGERELRAIVDAAGPGRTVVLVTVHGPVAWKDRVNIAIRRTAEAHPNVVVADWDRAVQGNEEALLADDGVHPGPSGAERYAQMVTDALKRP